MSFKVIVAGSRSFNDYPLLERKLDHILKNIKEDIEIVCGLAKGADLFGKIYAESRGYTVTEFPADWGLGKKAGFIRNEQMAKYSNAAIIFWDGYSKGSKHMIDLSEKYKLKLRIIIY